MSISLLDLWMPILLGTFFAWIASALIHMVVKYHNSDYKKLSHVLSMDWNKYRRAARRSFPAVRRHGGSKSCAVIIVK